MAFSNPNVKTSFRKFFHEIIKHGSRGHCWGDSYKARIILSHL